MESKEQPAARKFSKTRLWYFCGQTKNHPGFHRGDSLFGVRAHFRTPVHKGRGTAICRNIDTAAVYSPLFLNVLLDIFNRGQLSFQLRW